MSRFLDHIVSTARTELAGALRPTRSAPSQLVVAAPADGDDASAPERPASTRMADDDAPRAAVATVGAPSTSSPVVPAPLPAPPAPPHRDRPDDVGPHRASGPASAPVVPDRPDRMDRHAGALAGAWIDVSDPRPSRRPDRSLAHLSPAAAAPSATKRATEPAAPVAVPGQPAARLARPNAPPAHPSPTVTPHLAERGVSHAAPRTREPQRAPAAPQRPAPAHELVIDQLDVRIVTEPPPRAPASSTSSAGPRTPSSLGAWRPSARRFLRQP